MRIGHILAVRSIPTAVSHRLRPWVMLGVTSGTLFAFTRRTALVPIVFLPPVGAGVVPNTRRSPVLATRTLMVAVVCLPVLTAAHGPAQDKKDKQDPQLPSEQQVMQVKLKRAQALLEALVKEDFKAMEQNSASLAEISRATAFLRAYKTEEYELQARVFQRSTDTLAAKAKEKNLDGATLAYLDMTQCCVACHNHFRGKKRD